MWHTRSASLVIGLLLLTLPPMPAAAEQTQQQPVPAPWNWPGPWFMSGDGYAWQFWWICPLMMLAVMAVVAVVVLARGRPGAVFHSGTLHNSGHSALQILGERFARGEIHQDEYREKKKAILSGG
jgi:putative membrane protein